MQFEVLGPLHVYDGGAELDLGGPRQRRVLALLLAAAPDHVSVDRLIEEVWSGEAPETASHVIRTYISNLRSVLGDRILSTGTRYAVDTAGDDVDAAGFRADLYGARDALESDPATACELATRALSMWRGRPFEDVGGDAMSLRVTTAALEEMHVQASEVRLEAILLLGRNDEAIPELTALVEQHPLRERFTAQLMLALYRSGRQAAALRTYRALHERLVGELGIDPSADVQRLEERILLQDPDLALRPPHNIPTSISSFVGRRFELGQVTKNVDAYRLVTLLGVGGVGKTRLAAEAAAILLDDFPDGIWWIDLATECEAARLASKVAETLGVAAQPGIAPTEGLKRLLSDRATLLVFDNCERVAEAVGRLVAVLLAASPGLKVLATSRRPLNVSGEVRFQVPPLSLPDPIRIGGEAGVSDAERLFSARAQDVSPGLQIGPTAAESVAEICIHLEGLPLAIEMAAARAAVLSPTQIAEKLHTDQSFLSAPEVDRPARQRTVEAAIEWSYDLLTPPERAVLERIAVFNGSFELEAATAVAGFGGLDDRGVLDAIAGLVEASLLAALSPAAGSVRYRQLDTIRRFALSRLDESGVRTEAERRHAAHYLGLARAAGEFRTTPQIGPWMERIEAAHDELAPAIDWSLEHEGPVETLQALPGLLEYWQRRGDAAAAYRYGTRLLVGTENAPLELRTYALICASFGAALTGDFDLAGRLSQAAPELAAEASEWQCLLWALMTRGQVATILGDLPTVTAMGEAVLDVCDRHDLTVQRAYGLSLLAEGEFFSDGDYGAARRYAEEAIEGFRALGDIGGLKIYGLSIAAPAAALQGDLDAAERYATEAIGLAGAAWTAAAYVILGGYVLLPRGELGRARNVLERGTTLAYETSSEIWMRFGLLFLARLAADEERWEDAALLFGACRPNLPAWGHQPRWWTTEPAVRKALGEGRFHSLAADGEAMEPSDIVNWIRDRS